MAEQYRHELVENLVMSAGKQAQSSKHAIQIALRNGKKYGLSKLERDVIRQLAPGHFLALTRAISEKNSI